MDRGHRRIIGKWGQKGFRGERETDGAEVR
jgi:hypothetical protein